MSSSSTSEQMSSCNCVDYFARNKSEKLKTLIAGGGVVLFLASCGGTQTSHNSTATKLDPDTAKRKISESQKALAEGNYQLARKSATESLSFCADKHLAYLCRGYAEYKLGLIQAAISDFDEACKSAPNDFQCFEYRAAAYQTIKRYRKAIADYKIALEKLPNERNVQSKLYGELGMCYLAFGELAEAQISLRRAIELVPNRATLYAALATADLHLAETDRCIKDASQAIALDTNNAQAYQVRSRAYGALAQTELSKSDELSARKLFAAELEREYK